MRLAHPHGTVVYRIRRVKNAPEAQAAITSAEASAVLHVRRTALSHEINGPTAEYQRAVNV